MVSTHRKYDKQQMLQKFYLQDTMSNVTVGKYSFKDDAFKVVSDNAKDFIRCLLVKEGQ